MTDDGRMLRWWERLADADRDEWCRALAADDVSEPLAATLDDLRSEWLAGADVPSSAYGFRPGFRAFLESRCGPNDRG